MNRRLSFHQRFRFGSPLLSHAFSFWEVSEESCWNSEEPEGECGIHGKTGCWRQQKVWKGQRWTFWHLEFGSFFSLCQVVIIVTNSFPTSKVAEEVSKNLASLKEVLCGTGDKEPQTEAVAQLAQELYNTNLLIALIANLQRIDFEVGSMFFFMQWPCAGKIISITLHAHQTLSWGCVCLIWTPLPKAKMSLHIMVTQSAVHSSLWVLFVTGEEGCGSFVQQHCETSDWHSHTHSGVHLYTPTDPLHAFERVSSSFQAIGTCYLILCY